MVVVDPTGGLLNRTMAYRGQCGRVTVYDPSNELRLPELSTHWSPLGALNRAADISELEDRALATALDLVGSQDDAGTTNSKFFALTATSLLRCLLLAAVWDQREFADVMRWVSAAASPDKLDEVGAILADFVEVGGGDPEVLDAWGGFRTLGADRLSERFATAQANLLAFSFSSVKRSSDLSDPRRAFNSREFLRQPSTHYIVGSSKASERLMGLYVAHLTEIIQEAIDEAKRLKRLHGQDAVLPYQLVLLLEEVAQLASLPNLPKLLSEVRQYGIRIYFVFQDYSQILKKYGPHGAANIMNNAGTQLFLGGQNDDATKKLLRDVGQAWLTERTTQADADGAASGHNESRRQQDLLPLHVLPNLPQGQAILISTGSRPSEITTRFWKDHEDLVARVETPVEAFAADIAAGLVHTPVWPDDPDMTQPEAVWRELCQKGVRRRQAEREAGVTAAKAHFATETRPRPARAGAEPASAARSREDGWEHAGDVSVGDEPDDIRSAAEEDFFDDAGAADVCHDGRPVILVDPTTDSWVFADTGEYLDGPPNRAA
jgi:type IV secretory pathway TraG/TraD family ATPase VirD4